MILHDFLIYFAAGAFSGVLSGLFGVGGGTVIVPILVFAFVSQGFPEAHIMHMALGTSLATIILTSIASARAHHLKGNVNWDTVKRITPSIIFGTVLGALLAASLHSVWLQIIFAIFLLVVATQMALNFSPSPHTHLPGSFGTGVTGAMIGLLSSLVGIGGGSLTVPVLMYYNFTAQKAVGTSAAVGLPLAVAATAGYIFTGIGIEHLPKYSIGFIYIPALIGIAAISIFTAPVGAAIAQRLSSVVLKRLFALLLYIVGLKMVWGFF
ncbi:sulfite exporter TauE/SafE family protein [Methylovorus sp. MM2]|uniref:sulfite exporter TauE/SafE family protein n=1 Tax=Methylovorus sp. MM2 TaxID=1848038 RepID=UPI000A57ADEA|nr:sulfite exporter TauE/SafE family protein [Methylovorus sp. MM2]